MTSRENLTFWTQPKFRNKRWNRLDLPNTLDLVSLMTWNGVNMFLKFLVNQLRHWVFFSTIWLLHLSKQRKFHTKHWFVCSSYLSRIVRKPDFCLGENKGADQLRGNREADQRLCFRYSDSTIPLLLKSEISSF